ISPHLDDAILSCAGLLAARPGSTVVTVYTARAPTPNLLTDWDRRCGFANAAAAMECRLAEDREALRRVGATGMGLDFLDSQYTSTADEDAPLITERLFHLLMRLAPATVVMPLGLFHSDHVRVSDAALMIRDALPGVAWFGYEDVPYRQQQGVVQARLSQLQARGEQAGATQDGVIQMRRYHGQGRLGQRRIVGPAVRLRGNHRNLRSAADRSCGSIACSKYHAAKPQVCTARIAGTQGGRRERAGT
ncbi:MAG: PIG-L family deacetylase, partial [Achromobacter mucicolens]